MVASVKGSGAPVIVDAGEIDGVMAESPDEGGDFFLVKPFLYLAIALVEDPDVGFVVLDQTF